MHVKGKDPREIAETILERSICAVKVGAALHDKWGVHAWGWNSVGPTGLGIHAEAHCLWRGNWDRMAGSTLYVAAVRNRKNGGRVITAKPCVECQKLIKVVGRIVYRNEVGVWVELVV